MRRFAAAILLLILLPFCVIDTAAAGDISMEYTPKSERSSLFYIDVFCKREVTAAVFDLQFDDSMVSYHSVSSDDAAVSVRDNLQDGKVSVAFASADAVSGKLCRLSFKALKVGSVNFVLHFSQAADANKTLVTQLGDSTLTVKLGKDDIVTASEEKSKTASGSSSKSNASGSSSKSSQSVKSKRGGGDDDEDDEEDDDFSPSDVVDLRHGESPLKWVLIGAGIPILFGALIWLGILIGKRSKNTDKKSEEKPGEVTPEPEEKTEDEA